MAMLVIPSSKEVSYGTGISGSGGGYYVSRPAVCPICGETYARPPQTVYKRGQNFFCNYECTRKFDRLVEEKLVKPSVVYKYDFDKKSIAFHRFTHPKREAKRSKNAI